MIPMNTKLTLSIPKKQVENAKKIARKRGKTVSKMVEDYFDELNKMDQLATKGSDPIVQDLAGIINTGSADILAELFGKKKRV
jgi:hypothetical protein